MPAYDASVVLNLHKEGELLHKTLISLNNAARLAVNNGYKLELVAVLDCADSVTSDIMQSFSQHSFQCVNITFVNNGSLGLSRNDGVALSRGEYIFMADGDDLVSENYFYNSLEYSKRFDGNTVFFPEAILSFGDSYYVYLYQRLGEASPLSFLEGHPFISRVFAHRNIFEKYPYSDVRLSKGYAFEDWHFNCNIVAGGVSVEIVPNTILFYRQRKGSLLKEANILSSKQIPPSDFFNPERYLDIYKRYSQSISHEQKRKELIDRYRSINNNFVGKEIIKAQSIEPLIYYKKYKKVNIFSNASMSTYLGEVYLKIAPILGKMDYDDIYILPFISNGGAEKYINEVMWSLYRQNPESNTLVILCEGERLASKRYTLPPNATCLDFHSYSSYLTREQRCILIVKILQSLNHTCRVHIRQSIIGIEFLERYSKLFGHLTLIFYRFSDVQYVYNGLIVTGYSPMPILHKNIEHISAIICDNESIIRKDNLTIDDVSKWHFLPAPINIPRLKNKVSDSMIAKKVLWASRLDHEKRVELLPSLSSKLKESGFYLDVYGEAILGNTSIMQLEKKGVRYKGRFNGLNTIPLDNYTYFIYTSYYDGLPNVVLEAMAHGKIVVAPNVGGISEIIKHLETGYLIEPEVDDDQLVQQYIDAIIFLDKRPELLQTIKTQAFRFLEKVHSYDQYNQRVSKIFMNDNGNMRHNRISDYVLLKHYSNYFKNSSYEIECLHNKVIKGVSGDNHWRTDSKAYKLAALYVRTAHGSNMFVKMCRFGKSLYHIVLRKIRHRYFN